MKYDYAVKADGKWYPPGTDIPEKSDEQFQKIIDDDSDNGKDEKRQKKKT